MTEAQANFKFLFPAFLDTKFCCKMNMCTRLLTPLQAIRDLVCDAAYPKSTPALPVVRRQSHESVSMKARNTNIPNCTFILLFKLSVHDRGSSNFKFLFPAFSGY